MFDVTYKAIISQDPKAKAAVAIVGGSTQEQADWALKHLDITDYSVVMAGTKFSVQSAIRGYTLIGAVILHPAWDTQKVRATLRAALARASAAADELPCHLVKRPYNEPTA